MTARPAEATIDARSLAAKALDDLARRDAYADHLLEGLWRRHPEADPRDRALTTHLVYGVLRWRNVLDRHVEAGAGRPTGKIHPGLLTVLRLGAYQLLHLDRIPPPVAVAETVETARKRGHPHAAGFVNAVLRRIAEGKTAPATPEEPAERLALAHGLPPWLAEEWLAREGEAGAELLGRAASATPPLVLRFDDPGADPASFVALAAGTERGGLCRYAPRAAWVEGAGDPRRLEPVAREKAVVQSQASQLIAPFLAPRAGMRVLDACAAPGLKTSHLARLVGEKGEVTALELHPHRARMVEELAGRPGQGRVRTLTADATTWRGETPFDAVLADVPCSGLGVLAHAPERKWRLAKDGLAHFPPLQRAILENAAAALGAGGVLVYATCTTRREENEAVVEGFLADHPDFARAEPPEDFPAPGLLTARGELRTFPHDAGDDPGAFLDGFYAARLTRR